MPIRPIGRHSWSLVREPAETALYTGRGHPCLGAHACGSAWFDARAQRTSNSRYLKSGQRLPMRVVWQGAGEGGLRFLGPIAQLSCSKGPLKNIGHTRHPRPPSNLHGAQQVFQRSYSLDNHRYKE
jgi:hypothetical protein